VPKVSGWPGLLVGDMAQARGGPMLTGHTSHQVGLDADIWLTPMPKTPLSREEREEMSATNVVAEDKRDVDPKIWTHGHFAVIKAAAEDPKVERIFVNAAIKKALCREAGRTAPSCTRCARGGGTIIISTCASAASRQPGVQGAGPGRRDRRLRQGSGLLVLTGVLNPPPPKEPAKPKPPLTLADLPAGAGRCWWRREATLRDASLPRRSSP
jgi:penicillin-insensitive murein endopeptidase